MADGVRDPAAGQASWLEVARGIAGHLCDTARWREDACSWERASPAAGAAGGPAPRPPGGRLYAGSGGIALFLLRLHEQTADEAYLRTARGALAYAVEREAELGAAPGYYSGTAGVAAACAELGAVSGDPRWLDEAVSLCRALERAAPGFACDVNAGDAGSVLGLLRVHGLTDDGATLAAAGRLGDRLLARRRREPDGISWNGGPGAVVRNLLGLPNGAGGIGLALLELYRATGEERWFAGATQALRYEDSFFDPAVNDWPDLRHPELSAYTETGRIHQLKRAIAADSLPPPASPRPNATWRDGTPGIAMVRARFAEVTGLAAYRAGLDHAAGRCREHLARLDDGGDTLSLGRFGCADALVESARVRGEARDLRAARDAARGALDAGRGAEWPASLPPGLLLGSAGVGMFFLRLAVPGVASPLLPVPPLAASATPPCGEDRVGRAALAAALEHFARTEKALAGAGVSLPLPAPSSPAELRTRLEGLVAALPADVRERVGEAFALESLAYRQSLEHADRSERLVGALLRPRAELLDLGETRLRLAPTARLFRAAWDWEPLLHGGAALADPPASPGLYLVYDADGGWAAQRLDGLGALVASALQSAMSVDDLLARVMELLASGGRLQPGNAGQAAAVRERLRRALRQAYGLGIVEIVDPHGLRPADITSELCTRCGECCRVRLYIPGDPAYRDFVAAVLEAPLRAAYPEMTIGHERARGEEHVVLDLGYCHNLRREVDDQGRASFRCGIYAGRPEVCRSFNCVSWWRLQRASATGRTASDDTLEKVAALRKAHPEP